MKVFDGEKCPYLEHSRMRGSMAALARVFDDDCRACVSSELDVSNALIPILEITDEERADALEDAWEGHTAYIQSLPPEDRWVVGGTHGEAKRWLAKQISQEAANQIGYSASDTGE